MTDIVERLRAEYTSEREMEELCREAADETARLRDVNADLQRVMSGLETEICDARVLNARLRAALEAIVATAGYHEHPSIIIARQALTRDIDIS